jgi:hypothetical protein
MPCCKWLWSLTLFAVAQLASFAAAQQANPPVPRPGVPSPQRGSVTLDLSSGASFTINVSSNLPPFIFKLIPDQHPPDQYGNAQSTIRDIEVYDGNSNVLLQHLTGCDLRGMEPPPKGETDPPWFHTEDINFDGYQDVFLLTTWGATGNQAGCLWVYDPPTGHFEFSKEFSDLGRHWIDESTKTILTFGTGGMAGSVHNSQRYKVEAGHLLLTYAQNQEFDNDKKQYHCTVNERRGSGMVTTVDKWDDGAMKECEANLVHGPSRVKVDGPSEAAALISRVPPSLPPAARQIKGISLTVVFQAVIGKDGSVTMLTPLPQDFPLLIQPAYDAVKQWKYEPMILNDVPVEVETTISVTFSLN